MQIRLGHIVMEVYQLGGVDKHYNTMSVEEICNLPIPADKDCILYLWATTALLPEALTVMSSWGFKYKSSMVWDKKTVGVGYWFRGQHEFLLVGKKGNAKPPHPADRVSSVFVEKRTKHSKKPDGIRNLIAKWYPNTDKLEMFARQKTDGWDVFGNEVDDSIIL